MEEMIKAYQQAARTPQFAAELLKAGMTRKQIEFELGVPQSTLSSWLIGQGLGVNTRD